MSSSANNYPPSGKQLLAYYWDPVKFEYLTMGQVPWMELQWGLAPGRGG